MQKILTIGMYVLSSATVVLAALGCIITNELSGSGREIQKVENMIVTLHDVNTILSEEIASRSSVMSIQEQAKLLGLSMPVHSEALAPVSVAIKTMR